MTLRIGIDAGAMGRPLTGVGYYSRNLSAALERLMPEATFYAYGQPARNELELPSDAWVYRREPVPRLRRLPLSLWLKTRGRQLCLRDGIDVFWASRTFHPRLPHPVRTVCTVHDLNLYVVPETLRARTRAVARLFFAGDIKSAHALAANSQGTATRLRDLLGVHVDAVVRPGLDARFRRLSESERETARDSLRELGVREPYLLAVGNLEPRKNLWAVLAAFQRLKRQGRISDHQLVVVGPEGWESQAVRDELKAAARRKDVITLGYVPAELMPGLYALADCLVFPSLYEGFGMPALEARACGTRVVVSEVPEILEAGGDEATVVPPTIAGIQHGILDVTARGQGVAALPDDFYDANSWERSASKLAAVLRGRVAPPCGGADGPS